MFMSFTSHSFLKPMFGLFPGAPKAKDSDGEEEEEEEKEEVKEEKKEPKTVEGKGMDR